jgi:hypothetical protein
MRAPEVWSGINCFHHSDVWAFAVTVSGSVVLRSYVSNLRRKLFDWISPGVFGANDMAEGHWPQPWAIAKLLRLFPGAIMMYPTDPDHQGISGLPKPLKIQESISVAQI